MRAQSLFLDPNENGNWPPVGDLSPNGPPTDTVVLSSVNPAGGGTWTGWTITTTLVNGIPAMFAIGPDGSLWYYSPTALADLAYAVLSNAGTPLAGAPGPVQIAASGYGTATYAEVQAASFGSGALGLWTVDPHGKVTPWQLTSNGTSLTQLTAALTSTSARHATRGRVNAERFAA